MRWQREDMGDNSLMCASAVKRCPACSHKPHSRLRVQVTAAEDEVLVHALELAGCSWGQPYRSCRRLGLGVLEEGGCLNRRAEDTSWKAP